MPKAAAEEGGGNLRPRRSRKDRPCDHCRKAKRNCVIVVRGEACTHCSKAGRECSFNAPPLNRHRKSSVSPDRLHDQVDGNGHGNLTGQGQVEGNDFEISRAPQARRPSSPHHQGSSKSGPGNRTLTSGMTSTPRTDPGSTGSIPLPSPVSIISGGSGSGTSHSAYSVRATLPTQTRPHLPALPRSFPPPSTSPDIPIFPRTPGQLHFPGAVSWMAERSTLNHSPPRAQTVKSPSSKMAAFLDSLDEDIQLSPRPNSGDDKQYSSLDMEVTNEEESHYLGAGAVAHFGSVLLDAQLEASSEKRYRQVADPRNPAYFLRNPSRVYAPSNAQSIAEEAYPEVLAIITAEDPTMPDKLMTHYMARSLPAIPILNQVGFEASLRGYEGAPRFPYPVLIGIYAHAAVYEPSLRQHCKRLWTIALQVLDNEYRQPRLQTLQLEILNITGRPILNPGGNHIGICRAVGAMQLLGLHRDCSRWKLPKWERSLRKRLWWAMYIDDKWNAYTYGRPVNIEGARSSVRPLTLDDDDGVVVHTPGKSADISCFIALCRLSTILESLLPLLLDRENDPLKQSTERAVLNQAARDMETMFRDLPEDLVFKPGVTHPCRPGSCSLQLATSGVSLLICRLGLERNDNVSILHLARATGHALNVIEGMAVFLENLTLDDYCAYWAPWSAYQLTNAVTLLLQQALRVNRHPTGMSPDRGSERQRTLNDIFSLLARIVQAVQIASEAGWEVADAATPRIKSLIRSMPTIPGIERVHVVMPQDVPAPDWPGNETELDASVLALFDWLNGSDALF